LATATVDAILRPLEQGGLLGNKVVYRYTAGRTQDGLGGAEGTFNLCAFWLVEALTRAGRFDPRPPRGGAPDRRARAGLRHPPASTPRRPPPTARISTTQAFTHLALISAAVDLERALGNGP
jgi:hypothetical protein